jgi:hypothetical protein
LTAYRQGDKSTAVSRFLAVDWSARPLFASGSALNLSEDQFKSLSEADYHAKSREMLSQLSSLKELANAVGEAGHDAIKKGDATKARKCYMSLKQFGTALDTPAYPQITRLVGQGYRKMADKQMATIGQ